MKPILALNVTRSLTALTLLAATLPAADWASLRLQPEGISLPGPGSSQRYIVTAVSADGYETDVTAACAVDASPSHVAKVESGAIAGLAAGEAEIRAHCGGVAASARVRVGSEGGAIRVSFARHVVSILTTKGCNGSSCHGSPAGQSGFKLSLYGSDPEADHRMIVEGHTGRRVNRGAPGESLLLKKPLMRVPHGGGHLLTIQSDEYRVLLRWLQEGAAFEQVGARLVSLEMAPGERILTGKGATQRLAVIGRMSDGTTRDMTAEARFSVADEAVAAPVANGATEARGRGLTVVTARALGKTATAQFIVAGSRADAHYPRLARNNFIDDAVFEKLRRVNIRPFPEASDRTFVRRVYLDAVGLLPTPDQTEAFVSDSRPDKRAKLIDKLLESEEYSTHWLAKLEDWFRNSQYYSQGRTNGSYKRWLRELLRQDRPYDEAVREMLTATGDTTVRPAGNFWHPAIDFMLRTFDVTKATPTVTRLFLGQRLECAECHNHPLENLTQDDYYGMAAFLGRVKVKHGYGQYRRVWYNAREGEVTHPVTKKPVQPRFLDGTAPDIPEQADRRQVLADWITRTQRMQFARATVNRIWAEYFTTGIVEPSDDFRSTNRATHPELLDRMAGHFIDGGFRLKAVHRLILNSRTYQLASRTPDRPGGTDPLERLLLARYEPRKLPAEVLLDGVVQVTAVPHSFGEYPAGTSPKNLIASIGAPYFLTTFGFPRRDVMERRAEGPSLSQALHLMNSDAIRGKVEDPQNVLGPLLAAHSTDRPVVEALYLRAYARPLEPGQWNQIEAFLESDRAAGRSRRRGFENLLWVILNSKEFQINQ